MAAKTSAMIFFLISLLSLGFCNLLFADPVPQYLDGRSTFIGGISLYAMTTTTGDHGTCPHYAPDCGSDTCCPDGCCPIGTTCVSSGNYCCPSAVDCSSVVAAAPACVNSSWIMYARPRGKYSPYFCCEPDQIGVVPNLCVGNNITVDTAQLASKVAQSIGGGLATSAASSHATKTNTATAIETTGSVMESTRSTIGAAGSTTGAAGSTTGATTASTTPTGRSGVERSFIMEDWPIGVGVIILAIGFSLRLIV